MLTALACIVAALLVDGALAGLLRVPKVYNALITTNEKLVPSRAYSVSAPVFQPVGLAPAVPSVVVTSPYIAVDAKPNDTEAEPLPEVKSEEEKQPESKKNGTANSIPLVSPLPLAYYNSITYYHNIWPYSYSSVSPATFVFTAPFTYPGVFSDYYGVFPWLTDKKPELDSKRPESDLTGAKDDVQNDSVSVEAS
ncbi:hypothetical protein L9F63_013800 [Diploptera punctata]|uniref:Uncharacterized protein n=1 Tax=Diploptera punctata TaxID=6984 RepID=A0AAD8AA49_DIPPU|nr:hypothetical protein L9F63_013800 [Diploptera punctata]